MNKPRGQSLEISRMTVYFVHYSQKLFRFKQFNESHNFLADEKQNAYAHEGGETSSDQKQSSDQIQRSINDVLKCKIMLKMRNILLFFRHRYK